MAPQSEQLAERQSLNEIAFESVKMGYDATKQLTTLCSGSIVLIGTFLRDIFPTTEAGTLDVSPISKVAIACSLLFFGASLVNSAVSMRRFSRTMRELSRLQTWSDQLRISQTTALETPTVVSKKDLEQSYRDIVRRNAAVGNESLDALDKVVGNSLYWFIIGTSAFGLAVLVEVF
jgi:hypothetical protein